MAGRSAWLAGRSAVIPVERSPEPGHGLEQPVVRERMGGDAIASDHGLGGHEGVDDRLLGRLDRPVEQRVDRAVGDRADVDGQARLGLVGVPREASVPGRPGEEQVARVVPAGPADAGQAQTGPLGEPLALVREERVRRWPRGR